MKSNVITHIEITNPTTANNIAAGFSLGQEWINTTTGDKYYHKQNGVWVVLSTGVVSSDPTKANLLGGNTFKQTQNFDVEANNNSPTINADGAELGRFGAMVLRTCRGTLLAPIAIQLNDFFGGWLARTYNGSAYTASGVAGFRVIASENHTTTANGANITVETIANGTTLRRNVAIFRNSGQLDLLGNLFSAGDAYLTNLYVFGGTSFSHRFLGSPTANRVITLPNRDFTVAGTDEIVRTGVNNTTTVILSSATLNSIYPTATTGFRVYCTSIIAGAMTYEKTPTGWLGFACVIP